MTDLPPGWTQAPLADLTAEPTQRVPTNTEEFRYIDIASVDRESKQITAAQSLSGDKAPSRARKVVHTGDVLVSMTRPNLNAVALVPSEFNGQIASTGFDVLRPVSIEPRYLFAVVRSQHFIQTMSNLVQGALYPAVRSRDVRAYVTSVAPLEEQKRIADKVDVLLAKVETCRARLNHVPQMLKKFREAVLEAAVSGRLTEQWRQQRNRLSDWKSTKIDDVATVVRGASPRPAGDPRYFGGEIPWITVGELTKDENKYLTSVATFVTQAGRERSRFVEPGTLLLSNSGATLGVPKIINIGGCINDGSVALLGINDPLKSYLYYVLKGKTQSLRRLNQGAAQPNLNTTIVKAIDFLVPPSADEQTEVVSRIEGLFEFADRLQRKYSDAVANVARVTPSVLEKAFRGELVSQDPNDEPAEKMLERIRAERENGKHGAVIVPKTGKGHLAGHTARIASKTSVVMRRKNYMTKSRNDVDVRGRPYLGLLIKNRGGSASVEELFKDSDLPVDDFYKQLAWEITNGHVIDKKTVLVQP